MDAPRVLFFGSPDFAVPSLRTLIDSVYRPTAVVTQPDRPAGRGRALQPPPVKQVAEEAGIPALQPQRLRDPEAIAAITAQRPGLQVVAAYGQVLPNAVLDAPPHGTLNVHASLLPRWRGASPINAAILAGDQRTGVTIMLVDETEDTGDILAWRETPIGPEETAGELSERLAELGAALLLETIPRWLAGEITPQPQNNALATRARRLTKSAGAIDWREPAEDVARRIRAMTPWPGATTTLQGQPLRLLAAEAIDDPGGDAPPGTVLAVGERIAVQTGEGVLAVRELQRGGKRAMPAEEFSRGERGLHGARLGTGS